MRIDASKIVGQLLNNSVANQNPVIKNAIGLYRDGNSDELRQLCSNVCNSNGTTIQEMRNRLGI